MRPGYSGRPDVAVRVLIVLVRLLFQILSIVPWIGWLFLIVGNLAALAGVLAGLLCFIQLMTNGRVIELPYVGGVRLLPDLDE